MYTYIYTHIVCIYNVIKKKNSIWKYSPDDTEQWIGVDSLRRRPRLRESGAHTSAQAHG